MMLGSQSMKKILLISTFILILTSCGSPSPEEQLASAEEEKEELVEMLQTESVELERNKQRLKIIENEISQAETSQNDEHVQAYIEIVDEYSSSLVNELESLGVLFNAAQENEDFSEMNNDIDAIIGNINETISTYESEVSEIELNETLLRRHNSLELAHEEIPAALDEIKSGTVNDDLESIEQGISALNDISEYY